MRSRSPSPAATSTRINPTAGVEASVVSRKPSFLESEEEVDVDDKNKEDGLSARADTNVDSTSIAVPVVGDRKMENDDA